MRIVNNNPVVGSRRSTAQLQSIAAQLVPARERAITGIATNRPSDAPGRWGAIYGLREEHENQAVYQHNIGRATDVLSVADDVLGSASNVLQQAWERGIQLSSESWNTETRTAAASEIRELREELVGLANTRLGDRSLFAGDAWGQAAFDDAGNYLGSTATQSAQIGKGNDVLVAIDGSEVFQGGVDVFSALSDLEAALTADDPAAVRDLLPTLEDAFQQVVKGRQEVGYRQARVDDTTVVSEGLASMLEDRLYTATAADPAQAYTELANLTTTYEAALQVTAQSSGAKLFDLLR
ncbi:MAG: flagellin [Myxococcota bacterium]